MPAYKWRLGTCCFQVDVAEPSMPNKVRVYGPGVQPGVKMHEPTYFIVDCKEAGPGNNYLLLSNSGAPTTPLRACGIVAPLRRMPPYPT